MKRFLLSSACALLVVAGAGHPAAAQQTVSTSDLERLRSAVYDAGRDVSALRSRDSALATRLQGELDDLSDEVIYLRVKLRKEGRVAWSEYADVRDRLDALRSRARGDGGTSTSGSSYSAATMGGAASRDTRAPDQDRPYSEPRRSAPGEIPVGQELDVRLQTRLSSATAVVEDRFEATTVVDLYQDDKLLVPAGAVVRGVVTGVEKAGRLDRKASLTLSFDRMTVRGRDYDIRATLTQAIEGEGYKGDAAKIGAGATVGAIIGGLLGGVKGAIAGILIGGGGTVAATEGKDVELPAGTVLRLRFDSPVVIR
jgi:hypothetical protein